MLLTFRCWSNQVAYIKKMSKDNSVKETEPEDLSTRWPYVIDFDNEMWPPNAYKVLINTAIKINEGDEQINPFTLRTLTSSLLSAANHALKIPFEKETNFLDLK